MSLIEQWKLLHSTWGLGRLESEPIRKSAGFNYVSKYIVKNLGDDSDGAEWSRTEGKWRKTGRLYTWSRNMGKSGIERWKTISDYMLDNDQLPVNWMNMILLGKLERVYIPSDIYKKYCKSKGINLNPNQIKTVDRVKPLDNNEEIYDALLKQYADREQWLEKEVKDILQGNI